MFLGRRKNTKTEVGKSTLAFVVSESSVLPEYPVPCRDGQSKKEQRDCGQIAKYFICYAKDFELYALRGKLTLKFLN